MNQNHQKNNLAFLGKIYICETDLIQVLNLD